MITNTMSLSMVTEFFFKYTKHMQKLTEKYITACIEIVLGILFLVKNSIPWVILYFEILLFALSEPIFWTLSLCFNYKPVDTTDIPMILLNVFLAGMMISRPQHFMKYIYLLLGFWLLCRTLLSFIDVYVLRTDKQAGAGFRFLQGCFSLFLGIALLFQNFPLLSFFTGGFFLFEGLRNFLETYSFQHPDSFIGRHCHFSVSAPLFLSALYPIHTYVSLNALHTDSSDENANADLWIHLYIRGKGFESLGHMDISYQGTIYSYGCHDPLHRTLGGSLGDGVLIEADEKEFLNISSEKDEKMIISYGLQLSEDDRKRFETNLQKLKERTVPWHCAYETDHKSEDYASRVYKATHCKLYKFTSGKFKTYFVATTNCVLLADSLIHTRDFKLVSPTGMITPGSYLAFLDQAYHQNTKVIARTLRKVSI